MQFVIHGIASKLKKFSMEVLLSKFLAARES